MCVRTMPLPCFSVFHGYVFLVHGFVLFFTVMFFDFRGSVICFLAVLGFVPAGAAYAIRTAMCLTAPSLAIA